MELPNLTTIQWQDMMPMLLHVDFLWQLSTVLSGKRWLQQESYQQPSVAWTFDDGDEFSGR